MSDVAVDLNVTKQAVSIWCKKYKNNEVSSKTKPVEMETIDVDGGQVQFPH